MCVYRKNTLLPILFFNSGIAVTFFDLHAYRIHYFHAKKIYIELIL